MEDIKSFILDYIQREYSLPDDIDVMSYNYIESGYIDSLGLIQFIATIEDEFNITFSDEELADPNIRIIGKLIEIIDKKRSA